MLEKMAGALDDADFVLAGSTAIEGQSDEALDKRENALMRFFETLAEYRRDFTPEPRGEPKITEGVPGLFK